MVVKQTRFNNQNENKKIKLSLDLMTYDIFCKYILQPSSIVRIEHLVNLRKLMNLINPSTYENDPEKVKRVRFILKGLEARLDNSINDRAVILTYINGGLDFRLDFIDYDHLDLSRDEVQFVHGLVAESLQYQFVYRNVDTVEELCEKFKTSSYENRGNIVHDFENVIDSLKNEFRKTRIEDNAVDMEFSLRDDKFNSAVTNTYNLITNPSRRLITGMQGFNELIGGGFESGRVYMLIGASGVGKSITLLNLMYQIKMYNPHFKAKDPTKTPCVVLLTMENTVVETITRLFDLVVENSQGMANYTLDEVIYKLRTEGQLQVNDGSPIDLVIKYKANKSVDTSYFYTLWDDLDDQGYEMICLIQDHVKRIRSIYGNSDLRLELGDVVNEFKVFAADKDIPVITNTHLNRDATRTLEDAARKGNQDMGRLLGKSNIGESMLMIDNLDCGIVISLDFDKDENRYMTFNRVKMRDKASARSYIAQPFVPGSTIRLQEDVGGIPQFKESLHMAPGMKYNTTCVKMTGASVMTNSINDVIDDPDDEDIDENAFKQTSYNLEDTIKEKPNDTINPFTYVQKDADNAFADITSILSGNDNKPKIRNPFKKVV